MATGTGRYLPRYPHAGRLIEPEAAECTVIYRGGLRMLEPIPSRTASCLSASHNAALAGKANAALPGIAHRSTFNSILDEGAAGGTEFSEQVVPWQRGTSGICDASPRRRDSCACVVSRPPTVT